MKWGISPGFFLVSFNEWKDHYQHCQNVLFGSHRQKRYLTIVQCAIKEVHKTDSTRFDVLGQMPSLPSPIVIFLSFSIGINIEPYRFFWQLKWNFLDCKSSQLTTSSPAVISRIFWTGDIDLTTTSQKRRKLMTWKSRQVSSYVYCYGAAWID